MTQSALSVETDAIPDPEAYHAFAEFFKNLSTDEAPRPKGVLSKSFKNLKTFIRKLPKLIN